MAWDSTKSAGDLITSSDWNSMVSDQKGHAGRHTSTGTDTIDAGDLGGGSGTSGQVLQTDGSDASWVTFSSGASVSDDGSTVLSSPDDVNYGGSDFDVADDGDGTASVTLSTDSINTDEIDLSMSPTWTGNHEFDGGLTIGTFEVDADSGNVQLINMPVTSGPSAGSEQSIGFALDSADVLSLYSEADGSGGTQNVYIDANSNPIQNVTDPTNLQDAATKNYVDTNTSADTRTDVSEAGTTVVSEVTDINFTQSNDASVSVTDDTDGSVSVDVDVTDTNTTYSAGTGLDLSTTTFSLDESYSPTWTSNHNFTDGTEIQFGTDNDAQIYYDDVGLEWVFGGTQATFKFDLSLDGNGIFGVGNDIQQSGGKVIWDNANSYIPLTALEADSLTVAGNSVSLGGSTTISIGDLSDAALPNTTSAGQLEIWNATNGQFENATLTAGSGISITNSDASITLDAVTGTSTFVDVDGGIEIDASNVVGSGLRNSGSSAAPTLAVDLDIDDSGTDVTGAYGINFGTNLSVTDDTDNTVTVDAADFTVSDSTTSVMSFPSDINFGNNLSVTDDTDGTVTIDASAGSSLDVQEGGTSVASTADTLDFSSSDFNLSNPTTDEAAVDINTNSSYTLPSSDGSGGQTLITDGAGNVSWNDANLMSWASGHVQWAASLSNEEIHRIAIQPDEKFRLKQLDLMLKGGGTDSNISVDVYDVGAGTQIDSTTAGTTSTTGGSAGTGNDVIVRISTDSGWDPSTEASDARIEYTKNVY